MSIDIIRRNLTAIHQQIREAAIRSGRKAANVKLVVVTKYAEWSWIESLYQILCSEEQRESSLPVGEQDEQHLGHEPAGSTGSRAIQPLFGENRPQQLAERQQKLPDVEWHLIGQLQRNKVKLALQHASLIHSVDSVKLLERIAVVGQELHQIPRILIQVNLSREEAKSGFDADTIRAEWNDVVSFSDRVHIEGFMTIVLLPVAQAIEAGIAHDGHEPRFCARSALAVEKTECTQRRVLHAGHLVGIARRQDHLETGLVGSNPFGDVIARHLGWHHDIAEHDVDQLARSFEHFQGRWPVFGF